MHSSRTISVTAAALASLALVVASGCSSSGSTSTTTLAPNTTRPEAAATTSTFGTSDLPATGSVDGITLAVTSSPTSGTVGQTTIRITAVLTGSVKPAYLYFEVSDRSSASAGTPATTQRVTVNGPGRFSMPTGFSPPRAGYWAATVVYAPRHAGTSKLTVSGLPPVAGVPPPFPQLVTTVTG